jgi:hypothetical protein
VAKTRIGQKLARLPIVILMDQDAAGQHAKRAFNDAHILVQHQMMDIGAIEQRADGGNQNDIIGANQFAQFLALLAALHGDVNGIVPLPPEPAVSIV